MTILTLSFNSCHLLETIDSVLMQSYPRIQYIIVDDGSTNFDRHTIEFYIEQRKSPSLLTYSVLHNQQNLGTVKSSNIGLYHAKGDYIYNLAADDVFYDEYVIDEWTEQFLRTNALLMTGLRAVYDEALTDFKGMLPSGYHLDLLRHNNAQEIFKELANGNFIFGCSTARSRECIDLFGMYDEEYFLLDDYPMNLKITRTGTNIYFWERPVIKYRLGGVSSPEKFNATYEHDSDLALKKEILPYIKNPIRIWYQYKKWKFWHKGMGLFRNLIAQSHGNVCKIIIASFCHPLHALRYFKHKYLN